MNALALAAAMLALGQCPGGQCQIPTYRPAVVTYAPAPVVVYRYRYRPVAVAPVAARPRGHYRYRPVMRGRRFFYAAPAVCAGGSCR